MNPLPLHIEKAVSRYQPVEYLGYKLFPIKVRDLEEFTQARPAIEFVQRSLPTTYWAKPLLSAYFDLDIAAVLSGKAQTGMFARAIQFLVLSLRLGEGLPMEQRMKLMQPMIDAEEPTKLKGLRFLINGEEQRVMPPEHFQILRPILAAQNGIELEAEDANPELLEAERDIADQNGPKLEFSLHALMSTISTLTGKTLAEMDEWSIAELMDKQKDFNRVLRFVTCAVAEGSGASWKGGNPYPSPFFERIKENSSALIAMESYAGGAGVQAMQNSSE